MLFFATPPGVALATYFTAGSHINTALAPINWDSWTQLHTLNAKDTVNQEASAKNLNRGTQERQCFLIKYVCCLMIECQMQARKTDLIEIL